MVRLVQGGPDGEGTWGVRFEPFCTIDREMFMRRSLVLLLAVAALIVAMVAPVSAITDGELDGEGHPHVVLILMEIDGEPMYRCSGAIPLIRPIDGAAFGRLHHVNVCSPASRGSRRGLLGGGGSRRPLPQSG